MRHLLIALGFVLVAQTAAAQTQILISRQPLTWAWDAVTVNEAGQPLVRWLMDLTADRYLANQKR